LEDGFGIGWEWILRNSGEKKNQPGTHKNWMVHDKDIMVIITWEVQRFLTTY